MSNEPVREEDRTRRLMAMGQMAASLAHEIRNPLGSMELYCTLLKKDLSGSPKSFELAEQIHSGIKILDRIISNCLQFSRELMPKKKQLADTSELFQETFACAQARMSDSQLKLSFEEEGDTSLYIDSYLVQQALLNVVLNAVEAITGVPGAPRNSSVNGEEGKVLVLSDRRSPERWILSVIDNGPGIEKSDQDKIFDPFFTTRSEGTGLGLAIVHSIVAAHGGRVSLNSELGGGTSVVMEFPCDITSTLNG